ncbi:MAG: DUF3138 family protein [Betaproteobacteria bacterium]|nr:DUF3138 family protein [Betaproteobacteria bacterium]
MLKLKQVAVAVALAFPMLASAQSNAELQKQIEALKAEVSQLKAMVMHGATTQAAQAAQTAQAAANAVDPEEFNQVKVQVEALQDQQETAGFKGLRISGGFDPVYMYNRAKGTSSFAFLNNFTPVNGSGEGYSYDNSYFGMAYLDIQKQMDDGTKFRLTLAPSKSSGSGYNFGNIVHEASASIPLSNAQTRLLVGQMPDVSGYEPYVSTYVGANSLSSNLLYPGYGEYFVTRNMLFDFTAATFYTGIGLDLTRGPWETRLFLANFNSARNDVNTCKAGVACDPRPTRSPVFIYNVTYAKDEFWGFEFTGYEGRVTNPVAGGVSRLDQFEIDANFTRANFNGNLQATVGRQASAAFNGGNSQWWGVSALAAQRVLPRLTLAARADYLNNQKNGGGTFNIFTTTPATATGVGDFINGFGPGDPNDPAFDPNKGANRYALSFAATYRLTPNVALRGELRHDHASTPAFYYFTDQTYRHSNDTFGLQTIVNF